MVESRCGILCGKCEYKQQINCEGCLKISKPFWAEDCCPIKACSENKSVEHCGLCGEFPCELLKQFAYDKQQGDNGLRIEQCLEWAKN